MSDAPLWVTNVHGDWADKTLRMYAKSWPEYEFTKGKPNSTFLFTAEQLEANGVVGLYGQRKQHG
jgi:hypothetical protein